ncbi:ATP-binding cassette domain-containing protein [Nocardioides okcheonensis]|uniref:ATP-binding cassette domain-containing protein n=1 Tax=Nocardioides okcheonensis TaxID=2894081 RepID=UPI001E2A627F|nr:ATP-binding cassette domain-containing protein [Nocardioides okcheonensis]UFN45102.1 ATP-binding cassette domain-containing protein [Nocardioides okcheonensis]
MADSIAAPVLPIGPAQTRPALRASGLRKRFGDHQVLDGVDLEVAPGSVHALLGPNGAGKTTTVRIVCGLLRADEGRAEIAGHDVVAHSRAARGALGLSGQYAAVDEHLTGFENLHLLGRLYGMSRRRAADRADELLERFRLSDVAGRRSGLYSGGMRRRLDLAGALVARPQVVVLDEPTTGLDPRSRLDMWAVIEDLLVDGVAVLLTTQYLEEADRLADLITVIDRGVVIARGSAEELKEQVQGATIALRVRHDSGLAAAARALETVGVGTASVDPRTGRATVATDRGPEVMADLLAHLSRDEVELIDLGLHRSSLDDVFLALTGHGAGDPKDGGTA